MSAPGALAFADVSARAGAERVRIATAIALVGLVGLVAVAVGRLSDRGQLDWDKWEPLTQVVQKFLLEGLRNTISAAAVAMGLALPLGALLALLRLARTAPLRWFAATFVEIFRGVPLIVQIFFAYFGLRQQVDMSPYQALVLALAVYNGAVLGEVFRAGIRSLDSGQTEAAVSLGLGYWQAMRLVVLPQALRRMVPAIVSQMVTLLKDTSLGFVITYEELLRRGRESGEYFRNPLQTTVVVALIYIVVNLVLSQLARRLEVRQRRRLGAGAITVTGIEDLNAAGTLAASSMGAL